MRIVIHSGDLSLDNGAYAPFTQFAELTKLPYVTAQLGVHYGYDAIEIPEEHAPLVLELLTKGKMLYKVFGQHQQWQNVRTAEVQRRLACLR